MSAGLNVAMTALLVLVAAAAVCKSAPLADNSEEVLDDGVKKNSTVAAAVAIRKPALTYAAGPNQLTLLMDQGAFRFGYDTDNQFRAERRYPNGTVIGFYGFIGADGVPVRVKYGDVNHMGFTAMKEVIPVSFPPTTSTTTTTPATTTLETTSPSTSNSTNPPPDDDEDDEAGDWLSGSRKVADENLPFGAFVDEERNSITVDAAFSNSVQSRQRFVYPKIELDLSSAIRKRRAVNDHQTSSFPEPVPLVAPLTSSSELLDLADRHLVMDQEPGEPAIIYADPVKRIFKTLQTQFSV